MESKRAGTKQRKSPFGFGPNRRDHRRYNLQLELRWKLIKGKHTLDAGSGRTIDVSRGGVLFESGCRLPVGLPVELTINWPIALENVRPLQLVVLGPVVRSGHNRTAVQTLRFAFRSLGLTKVSAVGGATDS